MRANDDTLKDPGSRRFIAACAAFAAGVGVTSPGWTAGIPPWGSIGTANLTIDSLACDAPEVVGYLPNTGEVETHCTVELTVSAPLFWYVSFDVALSLVALQPSVHAFLPGTEVDSVVVGQPRFTTFGGAGSYTLEADVVLTDLDADGVVDLDDWLAEHYALGHVLAFRAELDPANTFAEPGELFPDNEMTLGVLKYFELAPLSGALMYGAVATELTQGAALEPSGGCAPGQLEMDAGSQATWAPGGTWAAQTLHLGGDCVNIVSVDAGGIVLGGFAAESVPAMTGTLGGLSVVVEVELGALGLKAIGGKLQLPAEHTWHAPLASGEPTPRGQRNVPFVNIGFPTSSGYGDAMDQLRARVGAGFLQARALPFALRVKNIVATATSVRGVHQGAHYAYDRSYALRDPRRALALGAAPNVRTNDIRYGAPSVTQPQTQFTLRPEGLAGTVAFNATGGATHFPEGQLTAPAFSASLVGGRLRKGQALGSDLGFSFVQASSCAECPNTPAGDVVYELTPTTATAVAADGAAITRVDGVVGPAWGTYDAADGHIFERNGDEGTVGVLMWPGFEATDTGGSTNTPVVDYLLGSRSAVAKGPGLSPLDAHLRGGAQANAGNYFFAGLTLGPEIYSGSGGVPSVGLGTSLDGHSTQIRFGGHGQPGACGGAPCDIEGNAGTKYVVRSDGITGAFNTSEPPDVTVYGYELPLSRFAFRLVSNAVDETTWMDGEVSLPDPGDFTVAFESLGFDCTGDVNEGIVVPCGPSSPPSAPNCGETLGAWQAPFTPLTIGFAPDGADDACGGEDRLLEVGKSVELGALDEPLGLTATWTADGQPVDARVTGETDHVLDRPASPAEPTDDVGLALAFTGPVELAQDAALGGSFIAPALLGAPFWDAFTVDVRLAQSSPTVAAPTVIVESGAPVALESVDPTDALGVMKDAANAVHARYTWGATGFEIDLQAGYQGNDGGSTQPHFVGLTKEIDLAVLGLQAAVNEVTPERTSISFGASADLDVRVSAGVDIHVDLHDPESILSIDEWLDDLGISGAPIEAAIGPILEQLDLVGELFSVLELEAMLEVAITASMQGALSLVAGIPAPYGDALEYFASLVASIEAVPAQLALAVSGSFEVVLSELLAPLTAELELVVLDIYAEVSASVESGSCGGPCADLIAQIESVRGALASIIAVLDAAMALLDAVPAAISATIGDATAAVDAALVVASDVAGVLVAPGAFATQFESADASVNVLLVVLVAALAPGLEPLLDDLRLFDILDDLAALAELIPLDELGLSGVQSDIQNQATALLAELVDIGDSFAVHIEGGDFSVILDPLALVLSDLVATLGDIRAELTGIDVSTILPLDDLRDAIDKARGIVEGADAMLLALQEELRCLETPGCVLSITATAAIDVQAELDAWMQLYTAGVLEFAAGGSFTATLADELRLPLDAALGDAALAIQLALPSVSLVAGFSARATLEATLVDAILGAEAVEVLLADVQAHFTLLVEDVVELANLGIDQVNLVIEQAVAAIEEALDAALEAANAVIEDVVPELPFEAARLDGYAILAGDELERLHIGASFSRSADTEEAESDFEAALDVTAWSTSGAGDACTSGSAEALLDVVISTANVPIRMGVAEVTIDTAELGFTLDGSSFPPAVRGVFGGITTSGGLDFETFRLYDMGLEVGVGLDETYLGAKASATFSSFDMSAAFLIGRTCGLDVLQKLDPQVTEFITLPGGVFAGGYARGSASFPVIDYGCLLQLELLADLGAWILAGPPLTVGGLVGGGASGKLGCIGALRGQVTLFGEKSGSAFKFAGEGFAAAGAGTGCNPETWTSAAKSREDNWCGTGDATIRAEYSNGDFDVEKPKVSAVH